MGTRTALKATHLLGVRIDCVTYVSAIEAIAQFMQQPGCHAVVTVNPEFLLTARSNPRFRATLNAASLAVPDGAGLVLIGRLFGTPLRRRVTGVDVTRHLVARAAEEGWSLFLIGGEKGSAGGAAQALAQHYPGVRIVGHSPGPSLILKGDTLCEQSDGRAESTAALLARMRSLRPDIVLVGFGAPKQEFWMTTYLPSVPSVRVAIGVGGTLDILSGRTPRAPAILRRLGLEWFWRLLLQPKRLRRILRATILFPIAVFFDQRRNKEKRGRTAHHE